MLEWIVLLSFVLLFLCGIWCYTAYQERKEVRRVHQEQIDYALGALKYQKELEYTRYGRSIGRTY